MPDTLAPFGARKIHVTWTDERGKVRHAWWTPTEIGVDPAVIERVEAMEAGQDIDTATESERKAV